MISVPSSSAGSRYALLPVESCLDECIEIPTRNLLSDTLPSLPSSVPRPVHIRLSRWERRLPRQYIIASTPGSNSLHLPVSIETIDTHERHSLRALLDCGATGMFLDVGFVRANRITEKPLQVPIPVLNVDGTPNEAGSIKSVVEVVLRYKDHSERAYFAVTSLGRQKMLLGMPWLKEHNPEVNWQSGDVKMSRCPAKCDTCRDEVKLEKRLAKAAIRALEVCASGPEPVFTTTEDEGSLAPDVEEDVEEASLSPLLEEGDRLLATSLPPEHEFIAATSTTSQRLAQAFAANSKVQSFRDAVPNYLHDFEDVFSKASFDVLPERKPWDHAIELEPGSKPSNCKVYPLALNEQKELDEFLQEHLSTGRIRPSKSPMASPVFFIKKKDGSLRLVQDYRVLNGLTVKNRYPLPLISDLVHQLRGARFFTKLDVRWGYNNVRIKEGDEWKAAFRTNRGLFEPLVMFFGLTNSPATFQTMMNDIFHDLIMEGVVVIYLDDILIFTKTLQEHRRVTRLVLARLRQHQLFLKHEKCEFEKEKIEYLGLIISHGQVEMDPVKVAGVAEWPVPKTRKEVQSFLGFVNFYRRFIADFSHYARPLFDLTKKDSSWSWSSPEQEAFEMLKAAVTSAPILMFPQDHLPYRVEADSSDFATGAVLSQQSPADGKWHPVAFYSKSLSPVERNYEIHDKEMLAVVRALEEWRHFLEGAQHPVEIWTDHKNLEYFMTARKLNRRQARWSLYLARFDFKMHHRPGRSMGKPDALSRRADHGDGSGDNAEVTLLKPAFFAICALEGIELLGEERDILRAIRRLNSLGKQEDAVAQAARQLKESGGRSLRSSEWSLQDHLLCFRGKIYVPDDPELRRRIVSQHHDSRIAGHAGRWKTLELVSRNYWWPQMSRYVGQYCKTCDTCLRTKVQRRAPTGELHPLPIPEARWDTISVDFIVELPDSRGYDAIMNVVDSVSKRAHFISTETTVTALGAARLYLQHVWKHHGLPKRVVSDRGPQFVAEFTQELYRLLGIELASSTSYHPQTDGQTERVNMELEQYLRVFVNERQDNWEELLPLAEFQYNNHVHSSTRETPFMLDTGRHPRMGFEPYQPPSRLETVNEFKERMQGALDEAKAALAKAKEDMALYYNRRREPTPVFKAGDKVYLDASDISTTRPSRKLSHRYLGPYPVERAVGSHAYRLKLPPSMRQLHPVFPVVKLMLAPPDPIVGRRAQPPPPPVLVDGEEEYEVEKILNSRIFRGKLQFLIQWKGYSYEHNSWEYEQDVYSPALVARFYRENPGAPRRIRAMFFHGMKFRRVDEEDWRTVPASGRRSLEGG